MDIHNKLILCKTLAFTFSSPIDTWRQNKLVKKKISKKKIIRSALYGAASTLCISGTCHKTMEYCESKEMNQYQTILTSVFVTSLIKTPITFNYRRIQSGLPFIIPKYTQIRNLVSLNFIEDIFEEGLKYQLVKNNNTNALNNAVLLFILMYPFDIMKTNQVLKLNLRGSYRDMLHKALYKNVQNYTFFQLCKTF